MEKKWGKKEGRLERGWKEEGGVEEMRLGRGADECGREK